jgi:chromosomal replication initiator protein
MHTFTNWLPLPENRSALVAVQRVSGCVVSRRRRREMNPLFLHGPAGSGKTHLLQALIADLTNQQPDRVVSMQSAGDVALQWRTTEEGKTSEALLAGQNADLFLLEDLQFLGEAAIEPLVQLFDQRLSRQQQMVFTATAGPGRLTDLQSRLTSRLASGLVVGLLPLGPESRRNYLEQAAQIRNLRLGPGVLAWLAEHHAGSVRQLEGAIERVETLSRFQPGPLQIEEVAGAFEEDAAAHHLTVDRIAQRVGRHFQIDPRLLQTRDRSRHVLLPRQVGMYLARELTPLSLQQIGAYFGRRDHSTVLHACRKVKRALSRDASLSGLVRELHADLT